MAEEYDKARELAATWVAGALTSGGVVSDPHEQAVEAAIEAFFMRWPDEPDAATRECWRDPIEHAVRAALSHALLPRSEGFPTSPTSQDQAALPHLEQERPDQQLIEALIECVRLSGADMSGGLPTWPSLPDYAIQQVAELRKDYDEACRECPTPQDKPPSRAGEVAEELRAFARYCEQVAEHTVAPQRDLWLERVVWSHGLADKLTEQEPSREES